MNRQIVSSALWLLMGLLAAATSWVYMHRVLLPWEQYFNVEAGTMKDNLGDLYSPWYGARVLLCQKRNPYSADVSREIQSAFYGHPVVQQAAPNEAPIDEQRFAYPVYTVFLLAPIARLDFRKAQAIMPFFLGVTLIVSIFLWQSVAQWRTSLICKLALALFILASPQAAQGLRLRQLGLIAVCLLAFGTWLVVKNHLPAGGVVLAFSTIKPQMAVVPLIWFLIWCMGDIRRRWRLVAGFSASFAALVVGGEMLLPGWLRGFLGGLAAYRKYGPMSSPLQVVLGNTLGFAAGAAAVAGLVLWAWGQREYPESSPQFSAALAAFSCCASLALPLFPPYNQVLLFLPVFMILRDWKKLPRSGRFVFSALVLWPWLVQTVLLVKPPQLHSMNRLPLLPAVLVILFPFVVPLLLYIRRRQISYLPT